MSKEYIYITDEIRMYRSDEKNIILEQLIYGTNPKTKEATESWVNRGYYRTFRKALKAVIERDLLIDEKQIKTVDDYILQVKRTEDVIKQFLEQ